jgi:hypothetical protein
MYNQIKKERKINTVMKPTISIVTNETASNFEAYRIFAAKPSIKFPFDISAKEFDEKSDEDDKKERADPNAINEKIKQFIMMVHGSYESRSKLIEDFSTDHSECSKASIERKIKEIASKDKEESQSKFRYFVSQQAIDESGVDKTQLQSVFQTRFKEVQDEIDKIEHEKLLEKQKEIEEKEKVKAIEKEKKAEEKRIEKEIKQAEKLKAKQEKERLKQQEKEEKEKKSKQKSTKKEEVKVNDVEMTPNVDASNIVNNNPISADDPAKRGRGRPKGSKNQKVVEKEVKTKSILSFLSKS